MNHDPKKIRPREGWAIVLAEPRKTQLSSGLYLPGMETGVEKVTEGSGRIIRLGGGKRQEAMGLQEDQRIVYRGFLKWANPITTGERWFDGDGSEKQYFVMSIDDIVGVIPEGVEVGVFSGRPQIPGIEA